MSPKIIDDQIIDPIEDSQPLKLTFYFTPFLKYSDSLVQNRENFIPILY